MLEAHIMLCQNPYHSLAFRLLYCVKYLLIRIHMVTKIGHRIASLHGNIACI